MRVDGLIAGRTIILAKSVGLLLAGVNNVDAAFAGGAGFHSIFSPSSAKVLKIWTISGCIVKKLLVSQQLVLLRQKEPLREEALEEREMEC